MTSPNPDATIVLILNEPEEMFLGPAPGRVMTHAPNNCDWDALGAALGEPGVDRLLRLVREQPGARQIVVRLRSAATNSDGSAATSRSESLAPRLRAWMHARRAANQFLARANRTAGLKALAIVTLVLGLLLGIAWLLQHESLGRPGAIRTLLAEALIIAGWVVMWRPIELLVFESITPMAENRLLRIAQRMDIRVETIGGTDAGSSI